ncbi:hypothetical protein ACLK1T_22535 [Escherichia coli]
MARWKSSPDRRATALLCRAHDWRTLGRRPARLNSRPACTGPTPYPGTHPGVNCFIGNHLTERLLREDHYEVYGLDIGSDAISRF